MFKIWYRKKPVEVNIPFETYRSLSTALDHAIAQLWVLVDQDHDHIEPTEKQILQDLRLKLNAVYFELEGTKRVRKL